MPPELRRLSFIKRNLLLSLKQFYEFIKIG